MRRPLLRSAERNGTSFAKRVKSAAMVQGGSCLSPETQKETMLPSRNAAILPRWFRAAAAFLRKRQGTALPSRNATNIPRWFRVATAFLQKRRKKRCFLWEMRHICRDDSCRQESFSASAEGISLHPGNAAILFRTIIPARSSLPQVPKACASAALCDGTALPGRRRDEKFHILLLRERPA